MAAPTDSDAGLIRYVTYGLMGGIVLGIILGVAISDLGIGFGIGLVWRLGLRAVRSCGWSGARRGSQ